MQQQEFENQLTKHIFKRRLITGLIWGAFLLLTATFGILREVTKVVIHPEQHEGWISDFTQIIQYNENYAILMVLSILASIVPGSCLLVDFLQGSYRTIQKDLYHITVYRGMLHNILYVDGQEMARTKPFSHSHTVEAHLPNGVRITVSFGRTIFLLAHISYSDNTPSIEV